MFASSSRIFGTDFAYYITSLILVSAIYSPYTYVFANNFAYSNSNGRPSLTKTTNKPIQTAPSDDIFRGDHSKMATPFEEESVLYGQTILAHKKNAHSLKFHSMIHDEATNTHRFRRDQYFGQTGWRVYGGGFDAIYQEIGGQITHDHNDRIYDLALDIPLERMISQEKAEALALSEIDCQKCYIKSIKTREVVLPHKIFNKNSTDEATLVYQIIITVFHTRAPVAQNQFFISMNDGSIVWKTDDARHATGSSLYSGSVSFASFNDAGTYFMEDHTLYSGIYDCVNGDCSAPFRMLDSDDSWTNANQHAAVDIAFGQALVNDFITDILGRDGIDGSGGPISTTSVDSETGLFSHFVHYGSGVNAATWTGDSIVYGDGDGTTSGSWVSIDIIAHEMMHGIVEYTADFTYYGESGALEESFGDIFAVAVDIYYFGERANKTWWFGEDVWTPGVSGDAIRMLDNPHLATNNGYTTNDDPDHVSEMYNGTSDNGGVHTNAGIPNKAFYLATKGGVHHLYPNITMDGIGIDKTIQIWYRALNLYLSSSSDFNDARTQLVRAARDLYGEGNESAAVDTAWALCGVGAAPTTHSLNPVSNGGFNNDASTPWVFSGTGVTYISRGSQPYEGTGYVQAGGVNLGIGNFYIPIYVAPNCVSANVTFYVNTLTSESVSNGIKDTVSVELRDASSGTLLSTIGQISNLDVTGTYSMRSFSFGSYKNYGNLRLQFSVHTSPTWITYWYIDNVAVSAQYY